MFRMRPASAPLVSQAPGKASSDLSQIALPTLQERNIVPVGSGILLKSQNVNAVECLRYVLSLR